MKKVILVFALVILSFSLVGCMSHIEDLNGDDTSLQSVDLVSSVEQGSYSSISSLSSSSYSGAKTYCFSYDEIDYDNIEMTYGKISGVAKVMCSDMSEGDELNLTITNSVTEGNFQMVVVAPDDTIVQIIDANTTVTVSIPSTQEGEYFVVVGAESAKVTIQILRDIN